MSLRFWFPGSRLGYWFPNSRLGTRRIGGSCRSWEAEPPRQCGPKRELGNELERAGLGTSGPGNERQKTNSDHFEGVPRNGENCKHDDDARNRGT